MSTFRRYLVVQSMTFVCGIVGPVFLIMFFASQPDPQLKWAFWAGLFVTYADIMIALGITAATRGVQVPQKVR
ncbi:MULTISPECIES: hypothetical protein [Mycobacterium]|uniref:Uncharacterized protein n=1 Tax=Mycobacterium kiyosense TaxID=2871094 RepID=A0A9P3QBR5_9MYCO|nr:MULTISPECIES: hypothetical protein [Mycobacterium]BDE12981.1 hypothetical protein MKCMC460_18410 [Mycobacterium sp. 20KCMC460]GLB85574.1 hypothetical protein SRL2020028_48300 [Mycobacterium kiyosense]GLB92350.1 hypothetical protein SRL2020130_51670 [Mycobacterium kiyosense]GLB98411.1 hypothetical protein SRL2020226_51870 [Mycobacterium kiyosense]GLC04559.1 hypothetical protein SRL2020400_51500 [Mycobacterium kiyosense]